VLTHNGGVFGFHQAVVAALARPALGLLDEEFFQQPGYGFVDKFRAVVGVKVQDRKRKLMDQVLQQRRQPSLTDARRGQRNLPLRDLVDGVDVVDSLALGESP